MSATVSIERVDAREGLSEVRARELAQQLRSDPDLLIAGPTETVYGLGGLVVPRTVSRLASWKARGTRPFLILLPPPVGGGEPWEVAPADQLDWNAHARELVRRFWPGPLTLVLPDPRHRFPEGVRSPQGEVACRLSSDPVLTSLLAAVGEPLLSTSANRPGAPPAGTADETRVVLEGGPAGEATAGDGGGDRWILLDGGPRRGVAPSTIVRVGRGGIEFLREGALSSSEIRAALAETRMEQDHDDL